MSPSDQILAARAATGDDGAFGTLVERHRPALVRTAAARLGSYASEAEDVVQDALGRALAHLRRGNVPDAPEAWLHAIVRNRAIDVVRHHPSRRGVPLEDHDGGSAETPHAVLARREQMRDVIGAVGALPGRQRDALVDVVFAGSSYEDVARAQSTSVTAVKALVNRARNSVRAAAAAVAPLPLILRDRVWLLASGGEPAAAGGVLKGCAVVGVVGAASLTVAPALKTSTAPGGPAQERGHERKVPRLTDRQLDRIAANALAARTAGAAPASAARPRPKPAGTRRFAAASAHTGPQTPFAVLRACSSEESIEGAPVAALRGALRRMSPDVEEYTDCGATIKRELLKTA